MEKKDYKLFFSLFLWMLIPSVYNAIRMSIISINQVDINILAIGYADENPADSERHKNMRIPVEKLVTYC